MRIPSDMQYGCIHKTRFNGDIMVLEYSGCHDVRVMFVETGYEVIAQTSNIRTGNIKDKMIPTLFGVGFLGGDYYKVGREGIEMTCYDTWRNMLSRCYSKRAIKTHPSYRDCEVCEEWQNYQAFAEWFYENYPIFSDIEYHIDKDIKIKGSRVYSPEACSFVPAHDNIMEMNERVKMKDWRLVSPDGDVVSFRNMSEFCRENGLSQSAISRLCNGISGNHRGWTLPK